MKRGKKMAAYVKFETPQAVADKAMEALEVARTSGGKIKIGVNEVTKAVERGKAKFVVMAEDVDPPEIMLHIPILCSEKKIPFAYAKTKDELGKAAGLKVSTSSVCILELGKADKIVEAVQKELGKPAGEKQEAKKEEKAEAKKEEKKAEAAPEAPKEETKPAEKPKEEAEKKKAEAPKEKAKEETAPEAKEEKAEEKAEEAKE